MGSGAGGCVYVPLVAPPTLSPPLPVHPAPATQLHPPLRSGSRTDACDIDFERGRDQSGRGECGQEKEDGGWALGGMGVGWEGLLHVSAVSESDLGNLLNENQ